MKSKFTLRYFNNLDLQSFCKALQTYKEKIDNETLIGYLLDIDGNIVDLSLEKGAFLITNIDVLNKEIEFETLHTAYGKILFELLQNSSNHRMIPRMIGTMVDEINIVEEIIVFDIKFENE